MHALDWKELLDVSTIEWCLPAAYVLLVGLAEVVWRNRKGSKSNETPEDSLQVPLLGALSVVLCVSSPHCAVRVFKQNTDGYLVVMGYMQQSCLLGGGHTD